MASEPASAGAVLERLYENPPSAPAAVGVKVCGVYDKPGALARNPLSAEERDLLKRYIFKGPFINVYLRAQAGEVAPILVEAAFKINDLTVESVRKDIAGLDAIIAKTPPLPGPLTVFRGETRPVQDVPKAGEIIRYRHFISTTRSRDLARMYSRSPLKGEAGILYAIDLAAGQRGLSINELVDRTVSHQPEFVLPRNTAFKVVSRRHVGGRVIIRLKLLPSAEIPS